MSGGQFDYNQRKIREIHEEIQSVLDQTGKEKPKEELRYFDRDYLDKYPEERFYADESENVKNIFKEGIEILKKAEVYAQRIDWYLSGDDGEESLISRLKEDLENLKTK